MAVTRAVGDHIAPAKAGAFRKLGIEVVSLKDAPVTVIQDARWPLLQTGANGEVNAGPTGNPWGGSTDMQCGPRERWNPTSQSG